MVAAATYPNSAYLHQGWISDDHRYFSNAPGFAGSWSNYPFFESGIVIVTSMREGLFVVRKRPPPVS